MQHIHFNVPPIKQRQLPPLAPYWLHIWNQVIWYWVPVGSRKYKTNDAI